MTRPSSVRVRFALVGIFAALGCAFLASPGGAQPGPPGFPGRPPQMNRPIVPPLPDVPRPGFGGLPGLPTYSWTCGKCNASLGTTSTPVNPHTRCPQCGVLFTGTKIDNGPARPAPGRIGGGNTFGTPPRVPAPAGEPPADGPTDPVLPTNPAFGNPVPPAPAEPVAGAPPADTGAPPPAPPAGGTSAAAPPDGTPTGRPSKLKLLGIAVGVMLLFGALVALGVVVSNAAAGKPVKRKRRPRFDDDE